VRGAMQAWLTAITRCHSVSSDRRAVSPSCESCRMSSGQSTLRFRDLHRPSFRPVLSPPVTVVLLYRWKVAGMVQSRCEHQWPGGWLMCRPMTVDRSNGW
jgi:hypothetical protein